MNTKEILNELQSYADESTKKTFMRHGAKEPLFGVKVGDLKKILKKTKKNHVLSIELYKSGNSDAMYLAGLMADETKITKEQLDEWVKNAYWKHLYAFAVPWVASETTFGYELGNTWILSGNENIAAAGWATLASYSGVNPDEKLDIKSYDKLLDLVEKEIHQAPNNVKSAMNSFVIAIGSNIKSLTEKALKVADAIGPVEVNVGHTACKVPLAKEYINKVMKMGKVGKKRKTARC